MPTNFISLLKEISEDITEMQINLKREKKNGEISNGEWEIAQDCLNSVKAILKIKMRGLER